MDNTPISSQHDALTSSSHAFELSPPSPSPAVILLSEVQEKALEWLWQDRLPLGKLITLEGDAELGKSLLAFDLAARVSSGQSMPDGSPGIAGGAGVVLIAPQDDLDDTILPRLKRAGADLSRFATVSVAPATTGQVSECSFRLPDDCDLLAEAIERVQAKLVIIDPIMSIVDPKLASKDPQLQTALFPLRTLVKKAGAACLLVGDPPKARRKPRHVDEVHSWLSVAASGFLVAKDPTDESKRVLAHITSKLCPYTDSLSFQIEHIKEAGAHRSFINWEGPSSHPLHDLFTHPIAPPAGAVRQQILEVLKQSAPERLSVKDLAAALPHITNANLRKTVLRMAADEQILRFSRGSYAFISPTPPQPPNPFGISIDYAAMEDLHRLIALHEEARQAHQALDLSPSNTNEEEQVDQERSSQVSSSIEQKEELP